MVRINPDWKVALTEHLRNHRGTQISTASLLGWFIIFSAYLAIIASYPMIVRAVRTEMAPMSPRLFLLAGCWVVILWYFLKRRHYGAILVHTIPPAVCLMWLATMENPNAMQLTLASCWLGTVLSFPISLVKIASGAGGRYPRLLCGLIWLYSCLHRFISIFASSNVSKISLSSSSSLSLPLNDSI